MELSARLQAPQKACAARAQKGHGSAQGIGAGRLGERWQEGCSAGLPAHRPLHGGPTAAHDSWECHGVILTRPRFQLGAPSNRGIVPAGNALKQRTQTRERESDGADLRVGCHGATGLSWVSSQPRLVAIRCRTATRAPYSSSETFAVSCSRIRSTAPRRFSRLLRPKSVS